MAFTIRVELEGMLERLHQADQALINAKPLYDNIGQYVVGSTGLRFETGIDPDGTPWPKSWRELTGLGKTLKQFGRLKDSVTSQAAAHSVAIGTNVIYAAIHQFGGVIKAKTSKDLIFNIGKAGTNQDQWRRKMSVTMPKRSFLGVSNHDALKIQDIVEDYIDRVFGSL